MLILLIDFLTLPGSDEFCDQFLRGNNWDPQTETSKIMKAGDNDITTWMFHPTSIMVKVWLSAVTMKIDKKSRVVSFASKLHYPRRLLESSWMISSLFRSAKKNTCSQKPWHYQKQKNVFQNSWSSTLLWPVLPQEAAMHTSNSWCCSLFPKAPGPSITNMIFPAARNPSQLTFKHQKRICDWVLHIFTKFPHQIFRHRGIHVMPLSLYTLVKMWLKTHVNQRVVPPPQGPTDSWGSGQLSKWNKQRLSTIHDHALGVQGVFVNPPE